MIDARDFAYLDMAEALAMRALGRTRPNPLVGAVIVRDGKIVGTGYHEAAGRPHAEIVALAKAGKTAVGATLYLTLEPCVHWGRTPPCAQVVAAAGLRRIVIASLDPNPIIHGRGVRRLRRSGLSVDVADRPVRRSGLNETHAKYIVERRPFVTLKAAVSLDGKLATRTGDARWISSPEARKYAHYLRSENDCILVGVNTVLLDDPRLTVRIPGQKAKPVFRAVLDPDLRTPPQAKLFSQADGGPVIIYGRTAVGMRRTRADRLRRAGAEVMEAGGPGEGLDLDRVLADLGRREIAALLVEGGGRTTAGFLEAGLADKVILVFAPLLIGGRNAVALFPGRGADRIAAAPRLRHVSTFRIGGDLFMEGYF